MAPTSGGQYHWVSMLAPPSCAKFLSYLTGWLTLGGWQGSVASGGYLTGTMTTYLMGGKMSEEIRNPSLVVPRAIMLSIIINGSMGFAMVIALLFCIGDIDAALATNTGYPYMEIFLQATRSVSGAAVMASIIAILGICATVSTLASTSRMFWSFSRDRGLPEWRTLQKVNTRTTIPLYAIAVTTVIACLLSIITVGSATAFKDVISLSVSGLYSSCLICAVLLLYRRVTGGLQHVTTSEVSIARTIAEGKLTW
ncbi:hypothetical protein ACHAO1_011231, partial [Botrytis cinerea]